jgi:hypothetical protein
MSHVIGYLQIGTILFILTFLSRLRYLWVNEVRSAETLAQGLTALFKFGLGLAFLTVLFWPIMVPLVFYWVVIEGRRNKAEDQPEPVFTPDRHCLTKAMSQAEIETLETVRDPLKAAPQLPFGHLNAAWRRFLSNLPHGCEFWAYRTDWKGKWGTRERREGYAAVIDGEVFEFFETVNFRIER